MQLIKTYNLPVDTQIIFRDGTIQTPIMAALLRKNVPKASALYALNPNFKCIDPVDAFVKMIKKPFTPSQFWLRKMLGGEDKLFVILNIAF